MRFHLVRWLPQCISRRIDRKSTRLNSSHGYTSYAVFCLKKKNNQVTEFDIISVDCDGNFSTFSPEFLGVPSSTYADFCFGDIMTVDIARTALTDKVKLVR